MLLSESPGHKTTSVDLCLGAEIHMNDRWELLSPEHLPLWAAHSGAHTTSRLCALASGLLFPELVVSWPRRGSWKTEGWDQ